MLPAIGVVAGGGLIAFGLAGPADGATVPALSDAELVAVSAGSASVTRTGGGPESNITAQVDGFSIDKTEVTVGAFRRCVDAGACTMSTSASHAFARPPRRLAESVQCHGGRTDRDDHPMNCVDWFQAKAYCEWAGNRLPTVQEWYRAARGSDGRLYPWGDQEPTSELASYCYGAGCPNRSPRTKPVGSFPKGASPFGVLDMAGNVWEWTSTTPKVGRLPSGELKLRCGGGYQGGRGELYRCWHTGPTRRDPAGGFRCAK